MQKFPICGATPSTANNYGGHQSNQLKIIPVGRPLVNEIYNTKHNNSQKFYILQHLP